MPVGIQNAPALMGQALGVDGRIPALITAHPNITHLKGEMPVLQLAPRDRGRRRTLTVLNGQAGLEMIDSLRAGCRGFVLAPDMVDHAVRIWRLGRRATRRRPRHAYAAVLPEIVFAMRCSSIWSPTASASSPAAPACRRTTARPASPRPRSASPASSAMRPLASVPTERPRARPSRISRVSFPTRSGRVDAVRGVSFELGREKLGIVGESGSGKSTIGRAILRLAAATGRVTADRLEFEGIDLLGASRSRWRQLRGRRIGMVLQDPKYSLNPVMRVGAQIAECLRPEA